jgi:hypothetical protein
VAQLKKSYSSINILQEKLAGLTESKGFFGYLFSNRKYLTVSLPYYDFLRGKVFLEDIRENFIEESPPQFGLDDLIYLLYNDFLTQIKRGAKNEQIAQYLLSGLNRHFQVTKREKRIMKPISQSSFEFELIEEEDIEMQQEKGKTAYLSIRMRESEILRAEVLLHDLENYLGGTEVSIEQIIAITYLDFIEKVKSEGNSLKVQKAILNRLM